MEQAIHSGRSKASALGKKGAGRSAHVMKPEYLAEIERFRLMDDTETAKRLLANGKLMLKEIAECTGLSLAQVKKLRPSVT